MATLLTMNSISRSAWRSGLLLIPLALVCFALLPTVEAGKGPPIFPSPTPTPTPTPAPTATPTPTPTPIDGDAGNGNTSEGNGALFSLTSGLNNTAMGFQALYSNTTASNNTATGFEALFSNTGGSFNTATGLEALFSNTTGDDNTANGLGALFSNTGGSFNTANGASALATNTGGSDNTATGFGALSSNTTGNNNTANGADALGRNTGSGNIALGDHAGVNLTTGDNNIDIGNTGFDAEANTIRIGTAGTQSATFIAGIRGTTTANADALPVLIDSTGQLGTIASSERFKKDIKPMDKSSEVILGLKPVAFHYKNDTANIPQFGLIAEDVAKMDPDLVARDAEGKIYTVRYDAVNAMLLNEFLKEHKKVEEQEATITQLKSMVAQQQKAFQATAAHQQKQIETLTAGLQKVSEQVEVSKAAPQAVANNQ